MIKRYPMILSLILLILGASNFGCCQIYSSTTAVLSGQVVDPYGMGIAGARIWIIDGNGQARETASNATGGYSLILAPGSYSITAELSGYSFTSATVNVQTNAISTAPRIVGYWAGAAPPASVWPATGPYGQPYYPGGTGWVQGRVIDQSGAGVPFASLNVDGWRTAYATDEQGNYRLELSPGMHIIDPFEPGYGIPPRAAFVASGQTTYLDFIAKGVVALGRGKM